MTQAGYSRSLAACSCLLLLGCVTPPPAKLARAAPAPAPETTVPAPSSEFRVALQRARELRQLAEKGAGPPSRVARDQAIVALLQWLDERREKTRAASTAYDATFHSAAANEQVLVRREIGDLWFDFVDSAVQETLAILPPGARSPEEIAALRALMLTRFSAETRLARQSFVLCTVVARQSKVAQAELEHCRGRIDAIDSAAPKPVDPALEQWRFKRLAVAPRKKQHGLSKAPCQLDGSAQPVWSKLYLDAQGPSWNLALEDVDVVELALPEHAGERLRLSIDYPLKASGYVEAKDGLLVTARRMDIVKGHIWLDPGTAVSAFAAQGAVATVVLADASQSTPVVSLQLPCADLALAGNVVSPSRKTQAETARLSGPVPLFDAPSGKQLGELNVDLGLNVRVLAHRNGWLRITPAEPSFGVGKEPYQFDAWIAERFARADDDIFGVRVLETPKTPPSHLTLAPLPVRLLPDPSAPVVSSLSIGVPLLAGEERGGMRRVHLDGAHGNNEGRDFWVATTELTTSASRWPAPVAPLKRR